MRPVIAVSPSTDVPAAKVQNGQLVFIPNTGHNPHFESPDLLFPPLVRFLQGQDVGERP